MNTASLSLTYTDCAASKQLDCNNITASLEPGESVEKTFQVKNTGNGPVDYFLYFGELLNTFKNDELVYTLTDMSNNSIEVNNAPVRKINATNIPVSDTMSIDVGITKNYKLTITFLNKDYDQSANANAKFSLKLKISESELNSERSPYTSEYM